MSKRKDALAAMRSFVGVPYSYGGGRPLTAGKLGVSTDCSGAVVISWETADPGCTGGASYTGDMVDRFVSTGKWQAIYTNDPARSTPGDVWVTPKADGVVGHTAMHSEGGRLIEEYPSLGREVAWYDYPWTCLLHYIGEEEGHTVTENTEGTYTVQADVLNVRSGPGLGYDVVASYTKGETVNLEAVDIYAEGYLWGMYTGAESGMHRYVAICKVEAAETYLAKA